jgi:hypothetical protein
LTGYKSLRMAACTYPVIANGRLYIRDLGILWTNGIELSALGKVRVICHCSFVICHLSLSESRGLSNDK